MDYFVLQAILEFIDHNFEEIFKEGETELEMEIAKFIEKAPEAVQGLSKIVIVYNVLVVPGFSFRPAGLRSRKAINADECLEMIEEVSKMKGGFQEIFNN